MSAYVILCLCDCLCVYVLTMGLHHGCTYDGIYGVTHVVVCMFECCDESACDFADVFFERVCADVFV